MSNPTSSKDRTATQDPNLTNALAYAAKHPTRYLFPTVVTDPKLRPKGKPAFKDNLAQASNDPAQLKKWHAEHRQRGPILWAVSLKKSGLCPLDVDRGPGKVGQQSLDALRKEQPLPKTELVLTPSGGLHYIYSGEHRFNNTGAVGENIDVPNYLMIAGTTLIDGRAYTVKVDAPVAKLPEFVAAKLKPQRAERSNNPPSDPIPLDVFKRMLAATPYTGGPEGLDDRHSYGGWLNFAMECHEAAGGEEGDYLDAFIEWSLADPNPDWTVPTSPDYIISKWESFTADPPPNAAARTRGSWLKLLDALGQKQFIGDANPAKADFEGEQDDVNVTQLDAHPSVTPEVIAEWQERHRKRKEEQRAKQQPPQPDKPFPQPLTLGQLLGGKWPPIEYALDGLIMKGVVNTFNADGGTGKTTLSTQFGCAVWAGREILGRKTKQAPVLLALGEDGEWVTQSRVEAQLNRMGITTRKDGVTVDAVAPDLPPFVTWCLLGSDMTLAKITDDGRITTLPFYDKLDAQLATMPGAFVVLDSLIDIVQMNMIEPMAVNAFFKRLLTGICQKHGCTILVLAHPSKASMSDGSWVHGSLAMKNAVRNSIAMAKVEGQQYRRLWSLKHNYGGDDELRLYFEKPLFTMTRPTESTNAEVRRAATILEFIIDKIKDDKMPVVHVNQGNGLTPRAIADLLNAGGTFKPGVTWKEVQTTMNTGRLNGVLRYTKAYGKSEARYDWIDGAAGEAEPQPGDFE